MARVDYITAETAPPETAALMAGLPRLNVFSLLAQAPTLVLPWLKLGMAMVNDLALPPALRELAVLQVGRLSHPYEWDQHLPMALEEGVTEEQAAALERGDDQAACFDAAQLAVLRLASDMVRDGEVSDEDYAALSAVLSDREIVEVASVIAVYIGLARIMTLLQIDPDESVGPSGYKAIDAAVGSVDG